MRRLSPWIRAAASQQTEPPFVISAGALATITDGDTAGTAVCQLAVANETGSVTFTQVSETVAGLTTSSGGAVTLDTTMVWDTNPSATYKATDSTGDTVNTVTVTVQVIASSPWQYSYTNNATSQTFDAAPLAGRHWTFSGPTVGGYFDFGASASSEDYRKPIGVDELVYVPPGTTQFSWIGDDGTDITLSFVAAESGGKTLGASVTVDVGATGDSAPSSPTGEFRLAADGPENLIAFTSVHSDGVIVQATGGINYQTYTPNISNLTIEPYEAPSNLAAGAQTTITEGAITTGDHVYSLTVDGGGSLPFVSAVLSISGTDAASFQVIEDEMSIRALATDLTAGTYSVDALYTDGLDNTASLDSITITVS